MSRVDSDGWIRLPSTVRQFWILAHQGLSWRTVLFNRFTVTLVVIAIITAGAQAYVTTHDSGEITGQVVDESGAPVTNATVVLVEVGLQNQVNKQNRTTDSSGRFTFSDADVLEFRIHAQNGEARSDVRRIHLYYRGQPQQVTLVLNVSAERKQSDTGS